MQCGWVGGGVEIRDRRVAWEARCEMRLIGWWRLGRGRFEWKEAVFLYVFGYIMFHVRLSFDWSLRNIRKGYLCNCEVVVETLSILRSEGALVEASLPIPVALVSLSDHKRPSPEWQSRDPPLIS